MRADERGMDQISVCVCVSARQASKRVCVCVSTCLCMCALQPICTVAVYVALPVCVGLGALHPFHLLFWLL